MDIKELEQISKEQSRLQIIKSFRDLITRFEEQGKRQDIFTDNETLQSANPLKHSFGDGCYIREIFMPAGELIVSKIHKKLHPFFVLKGHLSILTEDGMQTIKAPYSGITKPGTKRILYMHEDTVFITVHVTDKTELREIEEDVIAKDFSDPLITKEDMRLLTNKDIQI